MTELVLKEEVYEIVGAATEVYFRLGRGFLEAIYQEAIEIELKRRSIPFEARKKLTVTYKGQALRKKYIPDLFCYNQIIAELKVCKRLEVRQAAQLRNYLKATGCCLGLILNFGSPRTLEWRRYVLGAD